MIAAFRQLDTILRGDATRIESLKSGHIDIPAQTLLLVVALLGIFYGLCMGSYAMIRTGGAAPAWMQMFASAVKLPLLFFLTLLVTFPSLYVFNALVGSRLSILTLLRLLTAMLGVMLAVLASFGPIVIFFAVSTTSYHFMQLLHVALATVAGVLGLAFLLRTLHRLVVAQERKLTPVSGPPPAPPAPEPAAAEAPESHDKPNADQHSAPRRPSTTGALDSVGDRTDQRARRVFQVWVVVFALVGAQMSWILRPLIGHPDMPFEWFREREGNFFIAVVQALRELLGA